VDVNKAIILLWLFLFTGGKTNMTHIQLLKKNGKYIVFNPESLSLFSVTEKIGMILESYQFGSEYPPKDFNSIEIDIAELLDLFDKKINCDIPNNKSWDDRNPKALCLIISHDCNLKCGYCFANHGTFGGKKKLMKFKTAQKSIDKLLDKNSNNFILFYGGEPFLNFPLMKDIVEYGNRNELNVKYTTITNGTIMNDTINEFIHRNLFSLQLSLDGPKDINDLQRYGSVESVHCKVLETLDQLKSKTFPLSIKCTITKNSINKLDSIIEYLSSLGVSSIAFAEASLLPENSPFFVSDKEYENGITDLSHILVRNLNQLAYGNNTPIISPVFDVLRSLITKTRIVNYCSAGREYLAVTANGDVYPCHGFVEIDEFKMGNVHDMDFPGETYNKIKEIFSNLNVYNSEECSYCWARFLCGGDCAFYSYVYNNDLAKPTKRRCIMIKSIMKALLPEIAEIFQNETKMHNIINRFDKNNNMSQNYLREVTLKIE